jgi:hypothetical protein
MNGCDTNYTVGRVKEGMISDPKVLKRLQWVKNLDKTVQKNLKERIHVKLQDVPNFDYNPELYDALFSGDQVINKDTIMEQLDDEDISSRSSFYNESPLLNKNLSSPMPKVSPTQKPHQCGLQEEEKLSHVEIERLRKVKDKLL